MKIGLSLSYCVADIINGRVNRSEVAYIISGTRIRNVSEFNSLLENYARFYWQDNPELGKEIASDFYNRGMLLQPRILGGEPPAVFDGYWAIVSREV